MKKSKIKILFIIMIILILGVTLNYKTYAVTDFSVNVSEQIELSVSNVSSTDAEWVIEDTSIARVVRSNAAGVSIGSYVNYTYSVTILGVEKGITTLKLVAPTGETLASTTLEVTRNIRNISFDKSNLRLEPGDTYQLAPRFYPINPDNTADIEWISSDNEVLTVDENGKLEALKEGNATITATVGECSATINVKVKTLPEYTPGDVNSDGTINTLDAILALQSTSNKLELDDAGFFAADVNADDQVNTLDAIMILQYISNKISNF